MQDTGFNPQLNKKRQNCQISIQTKAETWQTEKWRNALFDLPIYFKLKLLKFYHLPISCSVLIHIRDMNGMSVFEVTGVFWGELMVMCLHYDKTFHLNIHCIFWLLLVLCCLCGYEVEFVISALESYIIFKTLKSMCNRFYYALLVYMQVFIIFLEHV